MKNWVARAFLNKLLSEDERRDLRKFEREELPLRPVPYDRQFLVGFEILRRYDLHPKSLMESQIMLMDKLFFKYQTDLENRHLREHGDDVSKCDCLTGLEALYAWEDYAARMMEESTEWAMPIVYASIVLLFSTMKLVCP